jgi:hypothetical protein
MNQKVEYQTKQTELIKEMEKQVSSELWSQYDTDVGLVKSTNQIRIILRPGAKIPRKIQYPLKPKAVEGIKETIEGIMAVRVLIETNSYSNTPILPVAKVDKSKWRLVHDLRAVNEIVEDWPAEVPNLHMLLINAPFAVNIILISDAHGFDHCARGEVIRKVKCQGFWFPYLQAMVDEYLFECDVCAQNNVI